MEWISNSPEETKALGQKLLQEFPEVRMICLTGPLGSGKTCFTKGIGTHLGIQERTIKSPTFTTLFEHEGEKTLYHCDFYRHEKAEDFSVDWWVELIENTEAIIVAEWSERIQSHLPEERVEIEFVQLNETSRKLIIKHHL
ncbi:MAG: tRNA (adenosine(37)-N6)-threonylcarbamoyltransferase complex ATPase subunit type 1 TsaE [Candidatus Peregrinibacteria bacterium]|nr:tRNA (adenosine(37)-N6)-threonylcarbamoyltransferase complex ATPase subunit type 1 TsaE [Candidatus Peregrinibacteria bacterium]